MQRMEAHYTRRMEAHEAIYEDEINSIITTFNANSDHAAALLKNVIMENKSLQAELQKS